MKRLSIVIFLLFVFFTNLFPQTYYVSSSNGNDNNNGLSESSPWKTIAKVNSISFNPGNQILFKRGDIWVGEQLLINRSGSASERIRYTSYGDGLKPIITLKQEVSGWDVSGNWTPYTAYSGNHVWSMPFPNFSIDWYGRIVRLWLDGTETVICYNKSPTYDNLDYLTPGEPATYGINSKHRFHYDQEATPPRLYVWTDGTNPASYYSSIEFPGRFTSTGTIYATIDLRNADYVTIDGLDIRGGMEVSILLNGSDYVTIKNCNISESNHTGIKGDGNMYSGDKTSSYVKIDSDSIDSGRRHKINDYGTSVTSVNHGVATVNGALYWEIHHNFIKDWWFGWLNSSDSSPTNHHKFYNNEVTAPDIDFAKVAELGSEGSAYDNDDIDVYNNYFHDITLGIQLSRSTASIEPANVNIFFNVFANYDMFSENEHAPDDSGVFKDLRNNNDGYIFNNTFYNTLKDAWLHGRYTNAYNNLFLETGTSQTNSWAVYQRNYYGAWINNLFYASNTTSADKFIRYYTYPSYSVSEFNALDVTGDINGNIYPTSNNAISDIMNGNFSLPNGSEALNAGVDISSLVPEGFTDRYGNVINRTKPDIGAVQHVTGDTSPPTLLGASLLDSTKLLLTFSEPLSSSGIASLSNYSISDGIIIYTAELNTNPANITLTTSSYIYDQNYSISVFNLQDLSGNVISSSNNTATYLRTFGTPSVGYLSKLTIIKVTASNTDDAPDKTNDGLYYSNGGEVNSRWKAAPLPQWLIYDLGAAKQINTTRISFYDFQNGRIYNYSISVSNDSVNWVNIVQNAASSNQEWTVNIFNPVEARFLKLELISNNQNEWATVWETEILGTSSLQTPLKINSKIYLQGAYENNQMRTNLRGSKLVPPSQPYISGPWFYNGYETASSIPNEVVDWILVELRSDLSSSTTIAKRAAFIRSDGSIVDLDGYSPVNFYGINNGEYYIIIRQRNHLSIMSANKVALTEFSTLYDFTVSNTSAYGNELAVLGDGKYGMYSGDGDANGIVNVLDYGIVGNKLFQTGYLLGDLDLNGTANVLDYGKANQNLLKISNVP